MDFYDRHPEFVPVAEHIRRAQAERSVYMAHLIAGFIDRIAKGFKQLTDAVVDTEREWHTVEAESFARHAAKRY